MTRESDKVLYGVSGEVKLFDRKAQIPNFPPLQLLWPKNIKKGDSQAYWPTVLVVQAMLLLALFTLFGKKCPIDIFLATSFYVLICLEGWLEGISLTPKEPLACYRWNWCGLVVVGR